ncbi:MAG: Crp/Fnr family transcriptional regulator [Pseudomonadota bacterium]
MHLLDVFRQQLKGLPFFDGLPDSQLVRLAGAVREERFARDELIFLKGDPSTGLFAVLAGTVKLACQSPGGNERVIALPERGQVFGEAALLLDCPYPFNASALTAARLLHVDGQALRDLVAESTDFAHRMLSHLSGGICSIIDDLEDFRMRAPPERIAKFLLDRSGSSGQGDSAIAFPAPKHVFASRLGMTPESLSRAMRDLAEAGLIKIGKYDVRVVDRMRLAVLAG